MARLATSMGIELSFMPIMFEYLMDYNAKFSDSVTEVLPGSRELCGAMAKFLEQSLKWRKIPFTHCSRDPDCVEVATNPYTTETTLFKAVRRIWQCAADHDLVPTCPYFNGGGAHIHVGNVGKTSSECDAFRRRMFIFGAQNPWLSWAFIGTVDDENAEPLTRELLRINHKDIESLREEELRAHARLNDTIYKMHISERWDNAWTRECDEDDVARYRRQWSKAKINLNRALLGGAARVRLSDIRVMDSKENVMRVTRYGKNGTVEFRAFEMPENEEALHRYVRLVDAIVRHVSQQTYLDVCANDVPSRHDIDKMTYSQRRAGFHNMLRTLGLDPAEWREETVHMAVSYRYRRPKHEMKPTHWDSSPDDADCDDADPYHVQEAGTSLERNMNAAVRDVSEALRTSPPYQIFSTVGEVRDTFSVNFVPTMPMSTILEQQIVQFDNNLRIDSLVHRITDRNRRLMNEDLRDPESETEIQGTP